MKILKFFRKIYQPRRQLSPRSVVCYERAIDLFGKYLSRNPRMNDLNDSTVCGHIEFLKCHYLSLRSVRKDISLLSAMWKLGATKNDPKTGLRFVEEGPDLPKIRAPELIPKAYSEEELNDLLLACQRFNGHSYAGVPSADWWVALHVMLMETGERISAAKQVEFRDLDGDVITFRPETRKGQIKPNIKRLSGTAIELINRIRCPRRDLIFPWDRSSPTLYEHYRQIREEAGVYEPGEAFHKLRKTLATLVAAGGGNAQAALGHASSATTQKHYLDRSKTEQLDYHKFLPKLAI